MTRNDIIYLINQDQWMMSILQAVKKLNIPDWWIGAGFVRSKVWDSLHNYDHRTPLPDIDVIYFDNNDFTATEAKQYSILAEEKYQKRLTSLSPDITWSVTNQARMYFFHDHSPYKNAEDALAHWVETATCIGCKLDQENKVELTAPWGIDDLVNLIIRPTPAHKHNKQTFTQRIQEKNWLKKWPKLKVIIE